MGGTFCLSRKSARHPEVAQLLGERASLFQYLDRARYPAPAEQYAGFAKNPCVTRTFFRGIHEDPIRNRSGRYDPRRTP